MGNTQLEMPPESDSQEELNEEEEDDERNAGEVEKEEEAAGEDKVEDKHEENRRRQRREGRDGEDGEAEDQRTESGGVSDEKDGDEGTVKGMEGKKRQYLKKEQDLKKKKNKKKKKKNDKGEWGKSAAKRGPSLLDDLDMVVQEMKYGEEDDEEYGEGGDVAKEEQEARAKEELREVMHSFEGARMLIHFSRLNNPAHVSTLKVFVIALATGSI